MSPDWITDWLSRCIIIVQFATLFLSNTDHGAPLAHSVGLFSAVAAETHCTALPALTAEL